MPREVIIYFIIGLLYTCPMYSQDADGDGIGDIVDRDNDNDGILDTNECEFSPTVVQNFTSFNGNVFSNVTTSGKGLFYLDFYSLDNSFNITINGTNIATEFQFQPGASGNFARFDDGYTYGRNGVPQVWRMTGTPTNPIIRVVIDADGDLELYGSRYSGGPLVDLTLDSPPNITTWNVSGNNIINIGQSLTGPTNMMGQIRFNPECDTDGDGIFNRFDLDSDNDGIYDAIEAGHSQVHTNGSVNGPVGTDGIPNTVQTDPNDKGINYILQDSDSDGIVDSRELDSDADGCIDVLEAGFTQSEASPGELQGTAYNSVNGLVTGNSDGYTVPNDLNGDGAFDFQTNIIPNITNQPVNTTICTACNGNLSLTALDADTYQWQIFDGSEWSNLSDSGIFSNTTTGTLGITNPTLADSGSQLRVVISNTASVCNVISDIAILSVNVHTVITNKRVTYRVKKN